MVHLWDEGGTPILGVVVLGRALLLGLRWRTDPVAAPLRGSAGWGLLLLLAWGVYRLLVDGRWFPQFSELGWI